VDMLYIFQGSCPLTEVFQVQNSLCIEVLCYPLLTALLRGTRAVGVSKTLRRGTRNGITEFSLLVIFNRGRHLYCEGTHHVGPHSTLCLKKLDTTQPRTIKFKQQLSDSSNFWYKYYRVNMRLKKRWYNVPPHLFNVRALLGKL